jgi:5-methylcytosine-specific restriction endonuclease McrA
VVCGEQFLVTRLNGYNRCCSRACGWKLERRRRSFICKECGNECQSPLSQCNRLFCSRRCYWKANPLVTELLKCANCGKEFQRIKSQARRRGTQLNFCSRPCQYKYLRGSAHPLWRGQRRQERGADWKERSAEARERDGHICQVCGTPEKKGQKLDVDHIVPFRLVKRNDLINLLSICKAPCHVAKTVGAERYFLRGDVLSFRQKLNVAGWPMERVNIAVHWWATLGENDHSGRF